MEIIMALITLSQEISVPDSRWLHDLPDGRCDRRHLSHGCFHFCTRLKQNNKEEDEDEE